MHYRRISADCHLDLNWLPKELFVSEAPREMKDRMPFVADSDNGPEWITKSGAKLGLLNGVGPSGQKYVPGSNARVDIMATTGLFEDGARGVNRIADPELRIKDMDRDGVDAEVIYGVLGASSRMADTEASNMVMRIYNDWMADFCSHHPDRHIGLACLPYGDVEAAVAEVKRAAKMGYKGLELSCSWDMEPMCHEMWDPLWEAVNEVSLPLHFHTIPNMPWNYRDKYQGRARRGIQFQVLTVFQMNLATILSSIMGAAVLERYPNLRIGFGESGIGWIPYVLDRMDFEWEDSFQDIGLKMKPSDYWKRQCRATFQFDRIGTKMVDDIGEDTIMWGSDFPHPDGVWPESSKYIDMQLGHLPEATQRKITCDNAAKFYNLVN